MTTVKRAAWLVGLVALAYLLWSIWDRESISTWMRYAQPIPFFVAMAALPAVGVPLTPFFVLAGATFGAVGGLFGSALALAANLALCYWIARSGVRPRLTRALQRFDYELPNLDAGGRQTLRFIVMLKLAPGIPAFAKNYLLGVAGAPFGLYFGVSLAISGIYGAALVVLGESLFEHALDRTVLAAAFVLVAGAGLWWWRSRRAPDDPATMPPTRRWSLHRRPHST